MHSTHTFTTQYYFGDLFYATGLALLVVGIPIIAIKWFVGIILFFVGVFISTSAYKLTIDLQKREIQEYLFLLGMKQGIGTKQFQNMGKIQIKKHRYSQQLNSRASSYTVEGDMYSAYLITDIDNFFLGESKNKIRIAKKMSKVASLLHTEVDMVD